MTDQELQQWVEAISLRDFGRPFLHRATFNSRLTSTGGRYLLKTHNIEISRRQWERFGAEEVENIIKHELCHYHLHLQNKGYRHRDRDFRELLQQVGGSRYCRRVDDGRRSEPYRYKLVCRACGTEYRRRRKWNPNKYVCGKCRGPLRLERLADPAAGRSNP